MQPRRPGLPLESAACPRMAAWCPSMEPWRPGLPLESSPSRSGLIIFLYLLLTTDLSRRPTATGKLVGDGIPRDIPGAVGKWHLTRMIATCLGRPAGSHQAPKAGFGASRRVGMLRDGLAGPRPPLIFRPPLRDGQGGPRQEWAPYGDADAAPLQAARRPRRTAARVGARSRGGHHPGKVH